jgi:ATP-dependent Clp protease adaptor protein ClpS
VIEGPGCPPGLRFFATAENSPHFAAPIPAETSYIGQAMRNRDNEDGGRTGVITRTVTKTKKPSMYKVLLLNDDYTPMEFVVLVLERFFNKTREEATRVMLHVHQKGVGVCGVYTFEVAETKVTQVMDFARQNQHPLQCTMEKD